MSKKSKSVFIEKPVYMQQLRRQDIKAMVEDGSIENEHFLIKIIAENMAKDALSKS